jgi:hypothetical protein
LVCDLLPSLPAPPPPPVNISLAAPISPCAVNIIWDTPPMNDSQASADTYILEIQLMSNGSAEEWVELVRSLSPPMQVDIPSRGLDTMYNLRGRGYNTKLGGGPNSVVYGPFVSYQDGEFPDVQVAGRPVGSDRIRVSWTVQSSPCYVLEDVGISCNSMMVPLEGNGTSQLVSRLEPDTEYNCTVSGVFTENGELRRIREMASFVGVTNTLPSGMQVFGWGVGV